MTRKTYILTQFNRMSIQVLANGIPVSVDFKGARIMPFHMRGRYTTTDEHIQKALESHPMYPGDFEIMDQVEIPDPVVEPVVPEVEPDPVEDEPVVTETTEPAKEQEPTHKTAEDGTILVSGITSAQKAKIYLNQHFDIPMSKLVNAEMVHAQAKICNVAFPDWQ